MELSLDFVIQNRLQVSPEKISAFCQNWKINEFALFGSILRFDFRDDSDIDVLVTFSSEANWSLLDWVTMKEQLKNLFQREVDITDKQGLKNPYRRYEILKNYQVIYAD